uniref:Ovule protein n=1 Tax=Syphacia muris TaxID=451379 RepID=A0A0N5AQM0_9BILA
MVDQMVSGKRLWNWTGKILLRKPLAQNTFCKVTLPTFKQVSSSKKLFHRLLSCDFESGLVGLLKAEQ